MNEMKMSEEDNELINQTQIQEARDNFDNLINQRISRMDVSQDIRPKFVIK